MTFSSNFFLIGLLPGYICIYNFVGRKNYSIKLFLLLVANCIFVIWGGVKTLLFISTYSFMIWLFVRGLFRFKNRTIFVLFILLTASPLILIKYIESFNSLICNTGNYNVENFEIIIPVGISFITFEAISLLADVYRCRIYKKPEFKSIILYLSFFPTVTSGPLIRYNEFANGINRNDDIPNYNAAIEKIVVGLSKKLLIADKIAYLSNYYFDGVASGNVFSMSGLWIGSIAYTCQIYFDFSGYSDIAIGISQLLGITVQENFNRPYFSSSMSDFWRRWHISLTCWFRDYVYIPLGGNRCSIPQNIVNMLIVWMLTGLWHGVDWSFCLWGLGNFLLLVFEKFIPLFKKKSGKIWGHIYTLFWVNILWIPFRAENIYVAKRYIYGMINFKSGGIEKKAIEFLPFLIAIIVISIIVNLFQERMIKKKWFIFLKGIILIVLFLGVICAVSNISYVPYIYGNF